MGVMEVLIRFWEWVGKAKTRIAAAVLITSFIFPFAT